MKFNIHFKSLQICRCATSKSVTWVANGLLDTCIRKCYFFFVSFWNGGSFFRSFLIHIYLFVIKLKEEKSTNFQLFSFPEIMQWKIGDQWDFCQQCKWMECPTRHKSIASRTKHPLKLIKKNITFRSWTHQIEIHTHSFSAHIA